MQPMRNFALEVHFSQWEFTARYNMAGSDAQSMRQDELLALASEDDRAAFDAVGLGYTQTFGEPALLAQIAASYETVRPEHVLCFAGSEEAIYVAMHMLLDRTDHAIVIAPNYQSAETVPLSICEVTGLALQSEHNWDLDLDRLSAAIRPNTKLISINFPNNPTGRVIPRASFDAIVQLCRKRGIWLFSDEIFRLLERDPGARLPQAVDSYERAISANSVSKAYGLPGLRIGWLACKDRDLLMRCERFKHYLSICNSAPAEILARIALQACNPILARNRKIIERNLLELNTFFNAFSALFEWKEPDAGCTSFIRYRGKDGVETFTRRLVAEAGVLLLPASIFRSEISEVPADYFRIGFGHSHVPHGLAALRQWLDRNA